MQRQCRVDRVDVLREVVRDAAARRRVVEGDARAQAGAQQAAVERARRADAAAGERRRGAEQADGWGRRHKIGFYLGEKVMQVIFVHLPRPGEG